LEDGFLKAAKLAKDGEKKLEAKKLTGRYQAWVDEMDTIIEWVEGYENRG